MQLSGKVLISVYKILGTAKKKNKFYIDLGRWISHARMMIWLQNSDPQNPHKAKPNNAHLQSQGFWDERGYADRRIPRCLWACKLNEVAVNNRDLVPNKVEVRTETYTWHFLLPVHIRCGMGLGAHSHKWTLNCITYPLHKDNESYTILYIYLMSFILFYLLFNKKEIWVKTLTS